MAKTSGGWKTTLFACMSAAALGAACSSADTAPSTTPRTVAGPAGPIWIDDGGSGNVPIVFLHSFAGSSSHWAAQLAHIRARHRAVAFDFRGHGQSAAPRNLAYTVDDFSADLSAVIETLNLRTVALVGHSQGGSAAIAYAAAHPDRVAGLLLVGTPGNTDPDQAKKIIGSIEADYDKVMQAYWDKLLTGAQPAVRARVSTEIGSVPKDASLAIIKGLFAFDAASALRRYAGPKWSIITPDGDVPGALHKLIPDLPSRTVTGTSHWIHLDRPDEFNRLLDEFLGRIQL